MLLLFEGFGRIEAAFLRFEPGCEGWGDEAGRYGALAVFRSEIALRVGIGDEIGGWLDGDESELRETLRIRVLVVGNRGG